MDIARISLNEICLSRLCMNFLWAKKCSLYEICLETGQTYKLVSWQGGSFLIWIYFSWPPSSVRGVQTCGADSLARFSLFHWWRVKGIHFFWPFILTNRGISWAFVVFVSLVSVCDVWLIVHTYISPSRHENILLPICWPISCVNAPRLAYCLF